MFRYNYFEVVTTNYGMEYDYLDASDLFWELVFSIHCSQGDQYHHSVFEKLINDKITFTIDTECNTEFYDEMFHMTTLYTVVIPDVDEAILFRLSLGIIDG